MKKVLILLAAVAVGVGVLFLWPTQDNQSGISEAEAPDVEEAEEVVEIVPEPAGPFELTLIHTNDTHTVHDNIARTATLIEELRRANSNHLLLSAGDVTSWDIGEKSYDSLANAVFMNHFGYDGMVLGNHEFDIGEGIEDHGPLSTYIEHAEHPVLAGNADLSENEQLLPLTDDEYTEKPVDGRINKGFVINVGGEDIGIFGITHYIETVTVPGDVSFSDHTEAAREAVAHFEAQGINKIIALSHVGIGHDRTLAEEVPEIDVIIGGHSHVTTTAPNEIGDTLVVQTGEYNTNLGELNIVFDENGKITDYTGKLHPVEQAEIHPDTERIQQLFDEATTDGVIGYGEFMQSLEEAGELDRYRGYAQ